MPVMPSASSMNEDYTQIGTQHDNWLNDVQQVCTKYVQVIIQVVIQVVIHLTSLGVSCFILLREIIFGKM